MSKNTEAVTKSLRIRYEKKDEETTVVYVNDRKIGDVNRQMNMKWKMSPSFPYIRTETDQDLEYSGPIEASRYMVKMWERMREAQDARNEDEQWYEKMFQDISF